MSYFPRRRFVDKIGAEREKVGVILQVIGYTIPDDMEEPSGVTHYDRTGLGIQITNCSTDMFEIELPRDELQVIFNCALWTLNRLDERAMSSRLGASPEEVNAIRDSMSTALAGLA